MNLFRGTCQKKDTCDLYLNEGCKNPEKYPCYVRPECPECGELNNRTMGSGVWVCHCCGYTWAKTAV